MAIINEKELFVFRPRIIAYFCDVIISALIFSVLLLPVSAGIDVTDPQFQTFTLILVQLIAPFCYFVVMETFISTTFGKKLTGLKVVCEDESKPSLYQVFIRNLGKIRPEIAIADYILGSFVIRPSQSLRATEILAGTKQEIYDVNSRLTQNERRFFRNMRILFGILGFLFLLMNIFLYFNLLQSLISLLY